jgi:TonB family protein
MANHPTSGRDPSPPAFSGARGVFVPPDDPVQPLPETDLADLTARFAASSGAGLSRELSTELALEIVLHEIVEQACLATGATGAAIVLQRDGEMVCRASSGPTAPGLGARLDGGSGLSGECIRTREVQRCEDAWADPRADGEASRQLGVRSVVILPLLREDKIAGIFEAFSSRPAAFGERDERTLEALVSRILKNLERAAQPFGAPVQENAAIVSEEEVADPQLGEGEPPADSRGVIDIVTGVLATVVLVCAVWVGVRVVQHFTPQRAGVQPAPVKARSAGTPVSEAVQGNGAQQKSQPGPGAGASSAAAVTSSVQKAPSGASEAKRASGGEAPEGSLLVFENGKEVFRMPSTPGAAEGLNRTGKSEMQRASSFESDVPGGKVMELTPAAAEDSLIHRVEPEYPEQARQKQIQGAVVLEARIHPDGTIESLKVTSGQPLLADAAMAAVKQWRFRQHQINGKPAEMQTTITLNFRLPR